MADDTLDLLRAAAEQADVDLRADQAATILLYLEHEGWSLIRSTRGWLREIEAMAPGDPCEFRFPARQSWHRGEVVRNGSDGYWAVRATETFTDVTGEDKPMGLIEKGQIVRSLHIEHVRPVGCEGAWL